MGSERETNHLDFQGTSCPEGHAQDRGTEPGLHLDDKYGRGGEEARPTEIFLGLVVQWTK